MENLIKPEFGLTFWTILSFILLVVVLSKYVWKPVLGAVEEREKKISNDLEMAQKAREDAERIKNEIEDRLKNLNKEIEERFAKAIYEANSEKEKIISKAQSQAELIISNAKKEAEEYKKHLEKELEKKIVEISTLISRKVLTGVVDKHIDEKIMEVTLKEYKNYRN